MRNLCYKQVQNSSTLLYKETEFNFKRIEGFGKYKSGRTTAQFHANGTH